ncbi:MAG: sulfatase-like hydrolase/transferase, partial [Verrucomicrobiales bacterium]
YTDEVVDFIKGEHDKPFFIYFAHHISHTPIEPAAAYRGKSGIKGREGIYSDFVLELDDSVGRVRSAVEEAGLAENTLIVFLSDNGPARDGSAKPLSGGKYVTMDGGHRVPGIFCWPETIPAGQVSGEMIMSMDLLPTFCHVAGVELPSDRKIDGKDISGLVTGETQDGPHEFFFYYNGLNLQAVRNAQWKLHFPRTPNDQPYWAKNDSGKRVYTSLKEPMLFDLDKDPGEKKNVIRQHPEIVDELGRQAEHARRELGDLDTVGFDQRPHGLINPQQKE